MADKREEPCCGNCHYSMYDRDECDFFCDNADSDECYGSSTMYDDCCPYYKYKHEQEV